VLNERTKPNHHSPSPLTRVTCPRRDRHLQGSKQWTTKEWPGIRGCRASGTAMPLPLGLTAFATCRRLSGSVIEYGRVAGASRHSRAASGPDGSGPLVMRRSFRQHGRGGGRAAAPNTSLRRGAQHPRHADGDGRGIVDAIFRMANRRVLILRHIVSMLDFDYNRRAPPLGETIGRCLRDPHAHGAIRFVFRQRTSQHLRLIDEEIGTA
jgi:hypothetical protein